MSESRKDKSKAPKCAKSLLIRKHKRPMDNKASICVNTEFPAGQNLSLTELNTERQGAFVSGNLKDQMKSSRKDAELPTNSNLDIQLPRLTKSFLDLTVRVFTQPLGSRSQWMEGGRGYVEFSDYTIRVLASNRPESNGNNCSSNWAGDVKASPSLLLPQSEALTNDQQQQHSAASGKTGQKVKKNSAAAETSISSKDKFGPSEENMKTTSKKREDYPMQKLCPFVDTSGDTCNGSEFVRGDSNNNENEDTIILEDTITTETIFIGKNCSIVWNSLDKKRSLCLMFCSVNGYIASWSALIAIQGKTYPNFELDFLSLSVRQALEDMHESSKEATTLILSPESPNGSHLPQAPSQSLPYSVFLHDEYNPPLGFIDKHFISLCLMQFGHLNLPELYKDSSVILALLDIANNELVEELLNHEVFPLLIKGLGCTSPPQTWLNPDGLSNLTISEELVSIFSKDLRAAQLLHILESQTTKSQLFEKLSIIVKRLRNIIMCALLSNDEILKQIKSSLEIAPPVKDRCSSPPVEYEIPNGSSETRERDGSSSPHHPNDPVIQEWQRAEQQVLANLRFLRSCITLGIAELGRDSVGPVVVKAFQEGILEVLSLVAERYAMPSGATSGFLDDALGYHRSTSGSSRKLESSSSTPSPNRYSKPIDIELNKLLHASITSLNEERDEQLMNEIVRSPILANPSKYNGLMVFMFRQVLFDPGWRSLWDGKFALEGILGTKNSFTIFDVLGLHDNESSISIGHPMSPKSIDVRNRFHRHFILKYLQRAAYITLTPMEVWNIQGLDSTRQYPSIGNALNSTLMEDLPRDVSPMLVRLLDYLITLASPENRELVLKAILGHKGHVLRFIERCYQIARINVKLQRPIGLDVLCTITHFIKTILVHLDGNSPLKERPSSISNALTPILSHNIVALLFRKLIYENNIFGTMLQAYQTIGGSQAHTLFHSMVLSVYDVIEKGSIRTLGEPSENLSNLRDYLFLKYFEMLPARFAQQFRETLLTRASIALGCKMAPEITDSVSCLSFTSGDIPRLSSELLFVDEIEASNVHFKGRSSPEAEPILRVRPDSGASSPEVTFLTILRTHNEQLAQANTFREEIKGFAGSLESFRDHLHVSPIASSRSLTPTTQNPPFIISDKGANAMPIRARLASFPDKSSEVDGPFYLEPTPPPLKSTPNNRCRSHSNISIDLLKGSGGHNSTTLMSKNITKYELSVPIEPLAPCENPFESNTLEKSPELLNIHSVAQKKDPDNNSSSILGKRNAFALPCLTKSKF
ncbi:unnamed protein product [Phytomonas sp. Hart1]|nr:unnamed protein product [Phytomonas sp. Hart1]|eukprot:CCW69440.1 unnamed protein product [Phytomonas sp. isolate Hart1]